MSELDRAQAILYGLALGDALGGPIEFLRMEKIAIIYGEDGIQEPPSPAVITDETQTSAAIAEALVEAVRTFEAREDVFDSQAIRQNAMRFDRSRFKEEISRVIQLRWDQWREGQAHAKEI